MGAYVPNQLGINRPHPLMPGSRTPVEGLYLCGSSSGNGGGVNGAPGYIAANAICDDLGLKRSWSPIPPPEWNTLTKFHLGAGVERLNVDLNQCRLIRFCAWLKFQKRRRPP